MRMFAFILTCVLFLYPIAAGTGGREQGAEAYGQYPVYAGSVRGADDMLVTGARSRAKHDNAGPTPLPVSAPCQESDVANTKRTNVDKGCCDGKQAKDIDLKVILFYFCGALCIFGFMLAAMFTNKEFVEYVFSHGGLRYITILLMLMAIVALGMAKVLEAKEISTLLGAIAGYILSSGATSTGGSSRGRSPDRFRQR